jgi:hypothetical protein
MSVDRPESLGSSAMEEDEDDLYGEPDSDLNHSTQPSNAQEQANDQDASTPDEDEDSDSDIEIVTERQQDDDQVP